MKVVISSQGKDLDSEVDPRFGRARYFIVLDTESGEFEPVDNVQSLDLPQGAGIQAAQNVLKYGPDAVLTGNCGPKAFQVLTASGVDVYVGVKGRVKDVIEEFKNGRYQKASGPNVTGHWV